eukprot:CCRYP_011185-RD/>CCRYP_011185-RD protein AED:0.48 eAED:1.00 QI:0/0/0/0.5/0/0/2/0/176
MESLADADLNGNNDNRDYSVLIFFKLSSQVEIGIDIGSIFQQKRYYLVPTIIRTPTQWMHSKSLLVRRAYIRIGSFLEQQFNDLGIAAERGEMKAVLPIPCGGADEGGVGFQQGSYSGEVARGTGMEIFCVFGRLFFGGADRSHCEEEGGYDETHWVTGWIDHGAACYLSCWFRGS